MTRLGATRYHPFVHLRLSGSRFSLNAVAIASPYRNHNELGELGELGMLVFKLKLLRMRKQKS